MSPPENPAWRPLSPHLQVYRLALTTVVSGLHRITGLSLSLSSLLLVGWLAAIACGAEAYARATQFFGSWPVRILLGGVLAIFWYHLFTGLRHLAWDAGFGFGRRTARLTGALVLLFTAIAFGATLWLTAVGSWLGVAG